MTAGEGAGVTWGGGGGGGETREDTGGVLGSGGATGKDCWILLTGNGWAGMRDGGGFGGKRVLVRLMAVGGL